jgi:hypothetical protein
MGEIKAVVEQLSYYLEETCDNLRYQPFYWGRVWVAWKSWVFRMTILSDSDLEDKVPKNNLGIHSTYCDKSSWSMGDGTQNFWMSLSEGYIEMMWDYLYQQVL